MRKILQAVGSKWILLVLAGALIGLTPASAQLINNPPVAVNDSYGATEDTQLRVAAPGVLSNDTDLDGNLLTVALPRPISGPSNGTLSLNADGSFDYTPAANFNGTDSFIYKANDGTADSATAATVTITVQAVNDSPVAVDDSYTVNEDTTLTVSVATGVLANDSDPDGNTLTVALPRPISGPSNGSLLLNADGSFSYTPAADFNGTDKFSYKANDGSADSATAATVTITVNPVQEPPVAANDSYSTNEDTVLTVAAPGVLSNDTDFEGNALTVALPRPISSPSNGTLTLNADGSFSYVPRANFNGTDSFTYKANDGTADSATAATVTVTIQAVNDPPVAVNDSYTTNYETALTVAAPGILGNDTDPESNSLTVALPRPLSGPSNGTITLNADGSFTYTPKAGFSGTDSFAYKANDGVADSTSAATVTITVNAAPQPVQLLSVDQKLPLVGTLDNPCTAATEAIVFSGTLHLIQEVWKMPNGNLRLVIEEETSVQGRDSLLTGGPRYGADGPGFIDLELAPTSVIVQNFKKVLSEGADDNFHVVLSIVFDPATLKLDIKLQGACDNGQQ